LTAHTDRSRLAARLVPAAVVGLAAGAVTEWSVLHLPFSLEPLSNTAAPWVLVAFAAALTARVSGAGEVVIGACRLPRARKLPRRLGGWS
jgi:Family of unknown function (DUF6518)